MLYKLILRRKGRYKKPVFNIIIVNKKNKFLNKIGIFNSFSLKKVKKIQFNIFLLFFWFLKGLKPSFFLLKLLKIFLK
jgi:ribosomal protein S16